MSDKLSREELRLEKVILDRLMEKQRSITQSSNDRMANLQREKKRVMQLIHDFGRSDPPLDSDEPKQKQQ